MESTRQRLLDEFHDPEARREYAEDFLDSSIAFQIKALRQQHDWTQQDLADRAEMKQSRISAMEQVDYSRWSLKTLRRLAEAFDLALVVRFESFGALLDDIVGLSRKSLERPSFDDDPVFHGHASAGQASDTECKILEFPGASSDQTIDTWHQFTVTPGASNG